MTLRFNLAEKDALAFNARYYHHSKTYQRTRKWIRLGPPLVFLALGVFQTWSEAGRTFVPLLLFGAVAAAWWFFYARRFDAIVMKRALRHMREDSYARHFGACELQLLDEHLQSTSPLGSSSFNWSAVERVEIEAGYLFIFLAGPMGYPIEMSQIGLEAAQQARDFVAERIAVSRRAPAGPPPLPAVSAAAPPPP
ncbi:MAG: YcxB family protein [Prosthecobacter sp.]